MPRLVLCLALCACAPVVAEIDELDPTTTPVDEPADRARFVGTWLIEETVPHATYFASKWEFTEDGTLTLVEDYSIGGGLYPSVSWAGNNAIACGFGQRWSSPDDQTLRVSSQCDDDETRTIELTFAPDAAGNTVGIQPQTLAVDGDTQMWSPPVWGWAFIRCEGDGANCEPWQPR